MGFLAVYSTRSLEENRRKDVANAVSSNSNMYVKFYYIWVDRITGTNIYGHLLWTFHERKYIVRTK